MHKCYVKTNKTNAQILKSMGFEFYSYNSEYQLVVFEEKKCIPRYGGYSGVLLYPEHLQVIALLPTPDSIEAYVTEIYKESLDG